MSQKPVVGQVKIMGVFVRQQTNVNYDSELDLKGRFVGGDNDISLELYCG